ncbi:inositol monophosphatase [Streptomyces sp. RKND-216]|uniref:inositol monophosphatase family protein n=1 Tax=Streptomyces sp. RKND-216 TaxID=2562581 RepID=UPI00109DB0B4|nr:inositol monophosphatase family protein [Streptomyces sp. RKND-216]THA25996.1 inositol monophosphatase [Streptomyces sp. RKND-216]
MPDELLRSGSVLREVESVLREVADEEIMARFRLLAGGDVARKSGPLDLVTVADRRAEERLTESLTGLLPGSVVVGEEAVDADRSVLDLLHGEGPVWIVDPLDGTRAFVHGEEGFCVLVALVQGGEVVASWTYLPARDRMAVARRGAGARLDGRELRAGAPAPGAVLGVATSYYVYSDEAQKEALLRLRSPGFETRPITSAGCAYLDVASGVADAVAFAWENPWDHAAGLLLVREAGGAGATLAGEPFRLTGGNALPLAAARDAASLGRVLGVLRGDR